MTDTVTIAGLHYLSGLTVAAFIAGLDCGDYLVDQYGQIVVPAGSDPDALFTPNYLALQSLPGGYGDLEMPIPIQDSGGGTSVAFVPVVIGLAYASRGQLLRPQSEADIKSPLGPAQGKTRRGHRYTVLLRNSGPFAFGTGFDDLLAANLTDATETPLPHATMYDGVHTDTLQDGYSPDMMLAWEVSRPYPLVVLAVGGFLHTAEM